MGAEKTFEHRSFIPTSPEHVMAFHAEPRALTRLAMPPTVIQVLRDERASLTSGEIEFNLWLGPVPVRWVAVHEPGPIDTSFTDRMVRGPMACWEHQHIFEPAQDGTWLIDRITLAHKPGLRGFLTRLLFDGLPLRLLFIYRHWRTRRVVT
jgi:ligand-binding SRPBCC domain-containing protein